jgi:hypothetical protein
MSSILKNRNCVSMLSNLLTTVLSRLFFWSTQSVGELLHRFDNPYIEHYLSDYVFVWQIFVIEIHVRCDAEIRKSR